MCPRVFGADRHRNTRADVARDDGAREHTDDHAAGIEIEGNALPKNFVVMLNDVNIPDTDADDPENFLVRKEQSLLNPTTRNLEPAPTDPDLHNIRYQIRPGNVGSGPADVNGGYPKPQKHINRVWALENQFGTVNVLSRKVSSLLVPAAVDDVSNPAAPGDATHYSCHQVKATSDVTDQTPDKGNGTGKFRKDLQAFFDDALFGDCAFTNDGVTPNFAGKDVEGMCQFDLTKPVELCNPSSKSTVEGDRVTTAVITGSTATTTPSLLCCKAKRSSKLKDPTAATLVSGSIGDKIDPGQGKQSFIPPSLQAVRMVRSRVRPLESRTARASMKVWTPAGNQWHRARHDDFRQTPWVRPTHRRRPHRRQ